ncbi:unnamed protein product [Adineta steineri]|uniref:SGNH hydrolase-type esterase domain-containing protein n=1 Tax=Adineta steineri TaxID=433720 RepID=A0A814KFS8_9BILA|nr:unnamed protein product [Adineta steineri]CAF1051037.1 unnamed protein product [Adineta steineri]
MTKEQQPLPLSILAIGDSLTAGYYNGGWGHHPYAIHLADLLESAHIPVKIDQRGVSGERVVPTMVNRLHSFLEKGTSYDWIIILGGTNDLAGSVLAENIFTKGLEPMYAMCLNQSQTKTKLAVMTVIENGYDSPSHEDDKERQILNDMIRNYVTNTDKPDRVYLVDLDKGILFHSMNNDERLQIWDDCVHLTSSGYDLLQRAAVVPQVAVQPVVAVPQAVLQRAVVVLQVAPQPRPPLAVPLQAAAAPQVALQQVAVVPLAVLQRAVAVPQVVLPLPQAVPQVAPLSPPVVPQVVLLQRLSLAVPLQVAVLQLVLPLLLVVPQVARHPSQLLKHQISMKVII